MSNFRVGVVAVEHRAQLAPVRLAITTDGFSPFRFQDYLTPDEADELADQLRAKATEIRTAEAQAALKEAERTARVRS